MEHLPEAPPKRPAEWAQVKWAPSQMKVALRSIYDWRSKALHRGIPFPAPMCEPPLNFAEWDAPSEKPHGLAMSYNGGSWLAKDVPMHLHIFAYIVQGAVNKWWAASGAEPACTPAGRPDDRPADASSGG